MDPRESTLPKALATAVATLNIFACVDTSEEPPSEPPLLKQPPKVKGQKCAVWETCAAPQLPILWHLY